MIRADSDGEVFILADTPNGQARFLILGDPASLYVCSEGVYETDMWSEYAIQGVPNGHTIVTGSTAPRRLLSAETSAVLRVAMHDHVHADLDEAGLDDTALSAYHTEAISAFRARAIGNR